MEVIINNSDGVAVDRALLKRIARTVIGGDWIVSLSFVSKDEMGELNRKYRHKDGPTDVLSFAMKEKKLLGDVVICPAVAKANAKKYGSSLRAEIARLFTHGLLHLKGLDHGKRMFDLQDKILGGVGYA